MMVAVVEIRLARPKVIPVVTATWPRRLDLCNVRKDAQAMVSGGYGPASDPGCKRSLLFGSQNRSPEVRPSTCRDSRDDFSHTKPDEHS